LNGLWAVQLAGQRTAFIKSTLLFNFYNDEFHP